MARAYRSSTAATSIVPVVVERGLVSNVPRGWSAASPRLAGRGIEAPIALRDRADHLGDLLADLADLVFADDQWWGQRQRIAGDAQHQVVVVEGAVQRVEAALAGQVRARREVDARCQADGA